MHCCGRILAPLPALMIVLLAASVSSFLVPTPPPSRGKLHHVQEEHRHHVRSTRPKQRFEAAAVSGKTALVMAASPQRGNGEKEGGGEVEEKAGIEPK